jgi:hypothetical protein
MPRWTQAELDAYEQRFARSRKPHYPPADPVPQSPAHHGPLAKEEGEAGDAARRLVRITSYRCRLLDKDNLYGGVKYLLDSLRYAKLIRDDHPEAIELEVLQKKVKTKKEQKTITEIIKI